MVSNSGTKKYQLSSIKKNIHANHEETIKKKKMNGIISKYMDWYMPKIRHVRFCFQISLCHNMIDSLNLSFAEVRRGHWHAFHPFDDHGGKHQPLQWPCFQIPQNLPCYDVTARSRWRKIPTQQKVSRCGKGGLQFVHINLEGYSSPSWSLKRTSWLADALMRWICIDMMCLYQFVCLFGDDSVIIVLYVWNMINLCVYIYIFNIYLYIYILPS